MKKGSTDNREEVVAVAIDKDKGSQYALKWTVDHLLTRGQALTLIHVNQRTSSLPKLSHAVGNHDVHDEITRAHQQQLENQAKELFLPYRCFCTRKDIKCKEVILEAVDIAKALIEYVSANTVEVMVFGAASKGGLVRRFKTDIPSSVSKGAPDFCTVYVIAKGKITHVRSATASLPAAAKTSPHTHTHNQASHHSDHHNHASHHSDHHNHASHHSDHHNHASHHSDHHNHASHHSDHHNHASHHSDHHHHNHASHHDHHNHAGAHFMRNHHFRERPGHSHRNLHEDEIRSPFAKNNRASMNKSYELSVPDTDISFVSNGRPSVDCMLPSLYDNHDSGMTPRLSTSSEFDIRSFGTSLSGNKSIHIVPPQFEYSSGSHSSGSHESGAAWGSQNMDEVEAEMRRLRLELKQTMDMYNTACKEALTAKQKALELHRWKVEEEHRLEEARMAEEAALAAAEKEKAKCKAALEAAEAAKRIAALEAKRRMNAEMRALEEAEERKHALTAFAHGDLRYRRYTIEEIEAATDQFSESRKIGEGGYGPVYMCELDHTPVAVKVLRPDAAQGRSQFQQEVEVLSCIRHPNMVLLLGACPEFGCLVYEYMANGSLEDRLFQRGNTHVLPWQLRFRIAAEIGTGLLFLHQTKPEPLVHRDLKPANILLDRNYVSKISDVGLARLVPPSVANDVTQYRMTSTAGTFCYIDPEYQQTGMLGIKSDVYSLGVMLLQIITAKSPMGLTHHVERAIEKGSFNEMLDPAVPDWPVEEALKLAKLALQCAEMRRKDRPDLGHVVLPELNRLRALAEDNMLGIALCNSGGTSPRQSQHSIIPDVITDSQPLQSESR